MGTAYARFNYHPFPSYPNPEPDLVLELALGHRVSVDLQVFVPKPMQHREM